MVRKPTIVVLAAVALCLLFEHLSGIYEPSETTGRGGNLCGLLVLLIGATIVGWRDRAEPVGRSLRRLVVMVAIVAVGAAALRLAYFGWLRGDFAGQMADFTRATLTARGSDPGYIESFTASVEASWRATPIFWNSLLLYGVWGSVLAAIATAITRALSLIGRPPRLQRAD